MIFKGDILGDRVICFLKRPNTKFTKCVTPLNRQDLIFRHFSSFEMQRFMIMIQILLDQIL